MPRLRFRDPDDGHGQEPGAIPFPRTPQQPGADAAHAADGSAADALEALDVVSRRMKDLARALGCLGYFDDDDDRPRAA